MKKNQLLIFLLSLIVLSSCRRESAEDKTTSLLPCDILNSISDSVKIRERLATGRVIRLETSDASLIGGRDIKIIKRNSIFYIRSFNEILLFDSVGTYIRKLSKPGNGNEEYIKIVDFDVVHRDKRNEIWIASQKEIVRYDSETLNHLGKIKSNDYINHIYYINDSTILTVTPGDKTLRVIDFEGNIRKSYLDKDIANITTKPIQFRRCGDGILYQIDSTNKAVMYSISNDSFSMVNIIPDADGILSIHNNREYFDKYGYQKQEEKIAEDFITISSFQIYGPQFILTSFHPSGSKKITIGNEKESYSQLVSDNKTQLNENLVMNSPKFLMTIIACDSDNGFLLMMPAEDINGEKTDANPSLLDIKL